MRVHVHICKYTQCHMQTDLKYLQGHYALFMSSIVCLYFNCRVQTITSVTSEIEFENTTLSFEKYCSEACVRSVVCSIREKWHFEIGIWFVKIILAHAHRTSLFQSTIFPLIEHITDLLHILTSNRCLAIVTSETVLYMSVSNLSFLWTWYIGVADSPAGLVGCRTSATSITVYYYCVYHDQFKVALTAVSGITWQCLFQGGNFWEVNEPILCDG